MIVTKKSLPRRTFLRGVGAAIGFSLRAEAVHLMTPEPDGADQ